MAHCTYTIAVDKEILKYLRKEEDCDQQAKGKRAKFHKSRGFYMFSIIIVIIEIYRFFYIYKSKDFLFEGRDLLERKV